MATKVREQRIFINTSDIMILGSSYRTAARKLSNVRKVLNKPENAFVTVNEFCQVEKLNTDEIKQRLNLKA